MDFINDRGHVQKIQFPFFTRLNGIIIVQIVFVLAASAYIFLFPSDETMEYADHIELESKFKNLAESIQAESLFEQKDNSVQVDSVYSAKLYSIFNKNEIVYSAMFVLNEEGIQQLYQYENQIRNNQDETDKNSVDYINNDLIKEKIGQHNSELVQVAPNTKNIVFYYSFVLDDENSPALIAVALNHQYIITSKEQVIYGFILLVLGGLLVSLLTVYFLKKKFQIPLNDLIKELENPKKLDLLMPDKQLKDVELKKLSSAVLAMHQLIKVHERDYLTNNKNLEKTHEELTHSKVFLKSIIDNSSNSIILTYPDGRIKIFNDQAVKEFGITRKEALAGNVCDLFTQPILWQELKSQQKNSKDFLCIKGNGTQFPAFVTFTPLYENSLDVSAVLYIVQDISESSEFDNMMIRLDRYYTKGEMAGDIAHEVNNFLAILSGNIELMPMILKKDDPELLDKKLQLMKTTVDRIVSFTDGLLEANDGTVKFMQVDLNFLVQTVLSFLTPLNKFDYIKVEFEPLADLPLVEVDPGQIQQLLVNLVYNAAEVLSGTETEKIIAIRVSIQDSESGKIIEISVADNGPGVQEDKVDFLFKKRFTTKINGHGIGLVTCQKIIDNHHGSITYTYQNGALFSFTFPIKQSIPVENETGENQPFIPVS